MSIDDMQRTTVRWRCGRAIGVLATAAIVSIIGADGWAGDTRKSGKGFDRARVDPEIRAVMERPRYRYARWGLLVQDLHTGRVVQRLDPDQFFLPGSTTKNFTVAAALDTLGAAHRFVTPLRHSGSIDGAVLEGDLILVAVGDLTLGGRDLPGDNIAFENFDHGDANAIDGATLTNTDPLSGLDRLADQVAADAGIDRVTGEVIIDDRLFETIEPRPDTIVSPIIVNDNLIDFVTTPTQPGQPAQVTWRPMSAAFDVDADITTVAAGEPTDIEISGEIADGMLLVRGQIAADKGPLVRVHPVRDPALFARTLLIEALQRAGVTVDAPLLGGNPTDLLPSEETVAALPEVATLQSAPFSEYVKLILKVSHNLGAELMPLLIAVEQGERTQEEGMARRGEIWPEFGVPDDAVAMQSASGLDTTWTTPRSAVDLLRHIGGRADSAVFFDALPILGIDGSLADVQRDSPAAGHIFAKTGTSISGDIAHLRPFMPTKALAGYVEAARGRMLAFSLYVNGVLLDEFDDPILGDALQVGQDLGEIAAIVWAHF